MPLYRTIRHKPRNDGRICTDATEWTVLEQSPSFYIVYARGEGYSLKRKQDYEFVESPLAPSLE
jgi:hypothetical protein